ncbi:MAG: YqgE/AlgH family protein [Anaerolineaceae bacterium]
MDQFVAGKLLVASPKLDDPNFARTVVYIGMHDSNGAFGLVLNRMLVIDVADHLEGWAVAASAPAVVFKGGPVEPSAVLGLASPLDEPGSGWSELAGGVGLVDLSLPASEAAPRLARLRVFLGYSGWGAGQLEDEIRNEGWFVVSMEVDDLFAPEPTRLWQHVLRRQPGKLAMFAYFPEDPTRN